MKRFGFTLTEVLITLGIIGTIAALTTPALVKNTGNAKVGPSLAKFVNTFETGMQSAMRDNEITSFNQLYEGTWASGGAGFPPLLESIVMTEVRDSQVQNYSFCSSNGSSCDRPGSMYQLKDGSIVFNGGTGTFSTTPYDTTISPYKSPIAVLLYDINGLKGNNRAGREVFAFVVDSAGMLIPYESNAYVRIYNNQTRHNCNLNSDDMWDSLACTGAYADNGWTTIED